MDTQDPNDPRPPDQLGEAPTEPMQGPQSPADHAPPPPDDARRLLRSRNDRMLGGVCGGLGKHLGVDPIILRIAAVALVFAGGAGLLAYVALLLLVPSEPVAHEGPVGATAAPVGRNRTLIVVGGLVVLFFTWPFLLGGGFLLVGLT